MHLSTGVVSLDPDDGIAPRTMFIHVVATLIEADGGDNGTCEIGFADCVRFPP
jgi:hypothetical protein